jgi:hypothetical protein
MSAGRQCFHRWARAAKPLPGPPSRFLTALMVYAPKNRVGLLHPTPDRDPSRFVNKTANMDEPSWLCLNVPAMRVEPLEEFPFPAAASLSPVTVAFLPFVPAPCEQGDSLLRGCVDIEHRSVRHRGSSASRRCSARKSVTINDCCQTPWSYPSMGLVPLQGPIDGDMFPRLRRLTSAEAFVTLFRSPQNDHLTIALLKEYPIAD